MNVNKLIKQLQEIVKNNPEVGEMPAYHGIHTECEIELIERRMLNVGCELSEDVEDVRSMVAEEIVSMKDYTDFE